MKSYNEHIYSLEDRQESDISPLWQILQVLFLVSCVVLGFTVCFTFSQVLQATQNNCILYAKLSFDESARDSAGRRNDIKSVNSDFSPLYCNLVTFIPVVISTFALFFAVMFAYCGRGGAGNQSMQETWRIILPTVLFNLVCLCLIAYSANVFQSGLKMFLRGVAAAWGRPVINLDEVAGLRLDGTKIGTSLVSYLSLTKNTTWLLVSFWGLNFLWILLRFLFNVDFQLVRTTIHVSPKTANIIRERRVSSEDRSESGSSMISSEKSLQISFPRSKTVQFTPSTIGPPPRDKTSSTSSQGTASKEYVPPQLQDDFEETEIGQVTYDKKET